MSRVGRQPIVVPKGVKVEVRDGVLAVEGPKGKVRQPLVPDTEVSVADGQVQVQGSTASGPLRARFGLARALYANAVRGAAEGFSKSLEIVGVGYKAELKGNQVHFALGYSHPVVFDVPAGIKVEIDKNTRLTVSGADRQLVGEVAAKIRHLRKPDPYKGKGVKYADEVLRRKVGKAGAK
jgi:large subunit ribosomal protein L6